MPVPRCVRFLKFGSDGGKIEEMVACVSEALTVIKAERRVKTCVGEDEDWGRKKKKPARGSVPCVECVILPHIYTPCSSQKKKMFSCLVKSNFPYVDLVEIKGVMSGLISVWTHTEIIQMLVHKSTAWKWLASVFSFQTTAHCDRRFEEYILRT